MSQGSQLLLLDLSLTSLGSFFVSYRDFKFELSD